MKHKKSISITSIGSRKSASIHPQADETYDLSISDASDGILASAKKGKSLPYEDLVEILDLFFSGLDIRSSSTVSDFDETAAFANELGHPFHIDSITHRFDQGKELIRIGTYRFTQERFDPSVVSRPDFKATEVQKLQDLEIFSDVVEIEQKLCSDIGHPQIVTSREVEPHIFEV